MVVWFLWITVALSWAGTEFLERGLASALSAIGLWALLTVIIMVMGSE